MKFKLENLKEINKNMVIIAFSCGLLASSCFIKNLSLFIKNRDCCLENKEILLNETIVFDSTKLDSVPDIYQNLDFYINLELISYDTKYINFSYLFKDNLEDNYEYIFAISFDYDFLRYIEKNKEYEFDSLKNDYYYFRYYTLKEDEKIELSIESNNCSVMYGYFDKILGIKLSYYSVSKESIKFYKNNEFKNYVIISFEVWYGL